MDQEHSKTYAHFQDIDWNGWEAAELATIIFIVRDDQILLIRKKRGLGAGKINGPGGRLDPGETLAACAARELEEELLVKPVHEPVHRGQLLFQFTDGYSLHVHVFTATEILGEPTETEEAIPLWTPLSAIPYHEMWADDKLWLPMLLEGKPFKGRFLFQDDALLGWEFDPV